MTALTKEAITHVIGPVDDEIAAELVATGGTEEELKEAYVWVENDEAMVNDMKPMPKARVARLVEVLRTRDAYAEEPE
jgi:hypothetical protein